MMRARHSHENGQWWIGAIGIALVAAGAAFAEAFPSLDHSVEIRATVGAFGVHESLAHGVAGRSSDYQIVRLDITEPKEFAGRSLALWGEYPPRVQKHRLQRGDTLLFTWLPAQDPQALVLERLPNLRVGNR